MTILAQNYKNVENAGEDRSSRGPQHAFVTLTPPVPAFSVSPLGDTLNLYTPPKFDDTNLKSVAAEGADSAGAQKNGETRRLLQGLRAERYRLLSAARGLLVSAGARAELQYPHNYHRTAKCKYIQHGGDFVGVHRSLVHGSAFFTGLVTCGSVWACPVCSVKIQERRRLEIAIGIGFAYKTGLQPVMVTLTFPHRIYQKLSFLLDGLRVALTKLRNGKPWHKFKDRYGFSGLIRSLELTHGENGWHPHVHELWFVDAAVDAEKMKIIIVNMWCSACKRAGILLSKDEKAFMLHAVDVKGNCQSSDYLAKMDDAKHWGVDREMAKASSKEGKSKGFHPFGLLANAAEGCLRSARLFMTYVLAMKGKRQIFWSHGLKSRAGVHDKTDEVLAEETRDTADLLGLISIENWKMIRHFDKRAEILDAAESGGWLAVVQLMQKLGCIVPTPTHDDVC